MICRKKSIFVLINVQSNMMTGGQVYISKMFVLIFVLSLMKYLTLVFHLSVFC